MWKGAYLMKEDYIKEIIEKLKDCDDIVMLDLIYQLLQKCQQTR